MTPRLKDPHGSPAAQTPCPPRGRFSPRGGPAAKTNPHGSPAAQSQGTIKVLAVLWLLLLSWPWLAPNDYLLSMGSTFFINLLLIASLNLLVGYTGLTSLAHAAFWGIGAYVSGMLAVHLNLSPWLGIPAAMLVCSLCAALIGWPTLRLSGHYLAMATLGFNAIISVLLVGLVAWTGGPNGLIGIPPFTLGDIDFSMAVPFYLLAWVVTGLVMASLSFLSNSRSGRALRAIHSSDIAAACMGIPVLRYKVGIFVLANAIAGLAGALYAHQNMFISPDSFSFSTSILLLVMVAVGGFGHYWGAFFGALIFTALPELIRSFHDVELLILGAAMILVVGFIPGGIAGYVGRRLTARHSRRQGEQA